MFALSFFSLLLIVDCGTGLKWYENSPEFANASMKQEIVWTELYEYGCCQDKLECRGNNTPAYLGVDVFTNFLDLKTILIIHQVNIMVSAGLGENLQIAEQHTGAMNTKAKFGYRDTTAVYLNYLCSHTQENNVGRYITGTWFEDADYLVCEDELFIRNRTTGEVKKKPRQRDKCTSLPHPAFCDRAEGKLMSIARIPKVLNDDNPAIVGFYSRTGVKDKSRLSREYVAIAWPLKDPDWNDTVGPEKFYGHLSEIDTFRHSSTGFEALYFTNDGNACYLNETYKDWFDASGTIKKLDFEGLRRARKPCESFQPYIGCPQPWCFSNKFDASFTVTQDGKTMIYFIKGFFYWIMEDYGLPLDLPKVRDARKPKYYEEPINMFPCKEGVNDHESVACIFRHLGAAFVFSPSQSDEQYIYMHNSQKVQFLIMKAGDKNPSTTYLDDPFSEEQVRYDAAWYNWLEEKVYLFYGQGYSSYSLKNNSTHEWNLNGSSHLNGLGIEFPILDAIVNRNQTGYFFSNNFYHEVHEDTQKGRGSKIFSMSKFFDVRRECYQNYAEVYDDLLSRHNETEEAEQALEEKIPVQQVGLRLINTRSRNFIVYFVVGGFAIALLTWVTMFVLIREKKQDPVVTETKRVRRKTFRSKLSPMPN